MTLYRFLNRITLSIIFISLISTSNSALSKSTNPRNPATDLLSFLIDISKNQKLNLVIHPESNINHRLYLQHPTSQFSAEKGLLKLNDILDTLELYAYYSGENLKVVSLKHLKHLPGKIYDKQKNLTDNEWVYSTIKVKSSVCVGYLVPMLRTLLPRYGHLAQSKKENVMIIFDRKANIDKIKTLIRSIEKESKDDGVPCSGKLKAEII